MDGFDRLVMGVEGEVLIPVILEEVCADVDKLGNMGGFCGNCCMVAENMQLRSLDSVFLFDVLVNG